MKAHAVAVAGLVVIAAAVARADDGRTSGPSTELTQLFDALQRPTVSAVVDAPAELRIGRALIRPSPGARLLVLSALGTPCGWVLDAPAQLTYRVEDRFSIPVAAQNLKRADGVAVSRQGDVLVVSAKLKGVAVWGWDLGGSAAPAATAPGTALPKWLDDVIERRLGGNPARDLLAHARHAESGFRWAVMHGDDDFLLNVDQRPSMRLERLFRWRTIAPDEGPLRGKLATEDLVTQPTQGAWWDAPAVEFATVDSELRVDNDSGEHATVTARVRIRSLRDGLRLLPLTLVRQFWTENGEKREFSVSKLTVDGGPAAYVHHPQGDLLVELPRSLANQQEATLDVVAEGQLLRRPSGDNYWMLGAYAWYPKPGDIGREWSAFKIEASSPSPFVPVVPGQIVSRDKGPTGSRVVAKLDAPMQMAVAVAGKYSTVTEEFEGRRVHVSSYAFSKEHEARRLAKNVLSVCTCLEDWLGVAYPFRELQMVEITSWGWGQAPPGVIFITQEAFLRRGAARLDDFTEAMAVWSSRGINERIAHEVAHGWFPHVVKIGRAEEWWLSESFAEYAAAVCLERTMSDRPQARFFWQRQLSDWKTLAKDARDGSSIYLAAYLTDRDEDLRTRRDLLYGKGPLVLHALRSELGRAAGDSKEGDRLFFTWMRAYVKNLANKTGETRHLVGILNQITQKDWQPWFERYVYGTETPDVK